MGPTGQPTEIPEGETVLLAGGGLGNAVLFSIAASLKARGNRVLYFAGYKRGSDLFKRAAIEEPCDVVVWSVDEGPRIEARRPQDRVARGQRGSGDGGLRAGEAGRAGDSPPRRGPDHRHRIGPDDERRPRSPRGRAARPLEAGGGGHRVDQLPDAMHAERGLLPMPAAPRRSSHGRGEASSSAASTRTSPWTPWTSRSSADGSDRTPPRRSSRPSGSTTCSSRERSRRSEGRAAYALSTTLRARSRAALPKTS